MKKTSKVIFSFLVVIFLVGLVSADLADLKINEVYYPETSADWVEIYNTGTSEIDLSQCELVDASSSGNTNLLSGTIISGGFLAFDWDSKLNNDGDIVTLICNDVPIDNVGFGDKGDAPTTSAGESIGRCPDGEDTDSDADDFEILNPTKGSVNNCAVEPECTIDDDDCGAGYECINEVCVEIPEPVCGNEIIEIGEACDDGLMNNVECSAGYGGSCDYCSDSCKLVEVVGAYCGDGGVDLVEECDDGNNKDYDGCSAECEKEGSGNGNGVGIGISITTESFVPRVWMCDNRVVYDDNTEPGRPFLGDEKLLERINNYAFEGEQIAWTVLVMDKNKIDQNIDVYATIGSSQGEGNDIEVNCERISRQTNLWDSCNARIQEEYLTFNPLTMAFFKCTLTVETPLSMYGEYWITVEAQDGEGNLGTMDENEYWFLNPYIALSIEGDLMFEDVRPGTDSYSDTLLIGNNADLGSGVLLDMFISGTDFYDSSSSGARCPTTNQLALNNFAYFATNGAYSTQIDGRDDVEGYVGIKYGIGFNNPTPFYDGYEIIRAQYQNPYYISNLLAPGTEMALTFKLSLPEPCTGNFDTGQIYFWGEAV